MLFTVILIMLNSKPKPYNEFLASISRLEDSLEEMDNGWERQSFTVVTPRIYADVRGNTIVYYFSQTTYYAEDPDDVTGLNMQAFQCVVVLATVDRERTCTVNGENAIIFEKGTRAYLCWTLFPEESCVLEYCPDVLTEAEMIRAAECVEMEEA